MNKTDFIFLFRMVHCESVEVKAKKLKPSGCNLRYRKAFFSSKIDFFRAIHCVYT